MSKLKIELEEQLATARKTLEATECDLGYYSGMAEIKKAVVEEKAAYIAELEDAIAKLFSVAEPRVWTSIYDIPEGVVALEEEGPYRLAARRREGRVEIAADPDVPISWITLGGNHRQFRPFTEVLDA